MLYESTRGQSRQVLSSEAIKMGIAPDGGLFVPERIPACQTDWSGAVVRRGYREWAAEVLRQYLPDFTAAEMASCTDGAYSADKFDDPAITPLRKLKDGMYCLELWHGPTCAFKDVALQILPRLLSTVMAKSGEKAEIVFLVATSGDTGKAALEGFRDVPGTRIIVFYPYGGVSEVQRLQMATQEGRNVGVVAVRGNFDDTQNGVKEIFGDERFSAELAADGFRFSSANSINWGRLAPQIVYYFTSYASLVRDGAVAPGEAFNIVVPTGNFGNILAAWYAKGMGLPVHKLICAANTNNVLTDFIRTGVYDRNRPFYKTTSPSMDILISSNLERLLYELVDRDAAKVRQWMGELKSTGLYRIDGQALERLQAQFWSDSATDAEGAAAIRDTYHEFRYTIDTHTAIAKNVYDKYLRATGDTRAAVIASTASPFKFNASVVAAIAGPEVVQGKDEFALLDTLAEMSGMEIPAGLRGLNHKEVRHATVCDRGAMKEVVRAFLSAR